MQILQTIAHKEMPNLAECWYGTGNESEMWAQNYVFALRECLKEMESDELDQYVIAEKLDCLTRDLVSDGTADIMLGTGFSLCSLVVCCYFVQHPSSLQVILLKAASRHVECRPPISICCACICKMSSADHAGLVCKRAAMLSGTVRCAMYCCRAFWQGACREAATCHCGGCTPSRSGVKAPAAIWSMRGRCWYAFLCVSHVSRDDTSFLSAVTCKLHKRLEF